MSLRYAVQKFQKVERARHRLEALEAKLSQAVLYVPNGDMSAYVMETEAISRQEAEGCKQCQEVPRRSRASHVVTIKATGHGGYFWECACGALGQPTPMPADTQQVSHKRAADDGRDHANLARTGA